MPNKYGLTRSSFTKEMKIIIRKRDGFGCVICGIGIHTYEHYNPEFSESKFHDIAGICLLCFQHQGESFKKLLSKTTIAEHAKNPKCKQKGFANAFFDLKFPIVIRLGNITFRTEGDKEHNILILGDEIMIKVNASTIGEPFQFSAIFKDKNDNISLQINKNEWIASVNNWDIKQIGNRVNIVSDPSDMRITIVANPPHELIFKELDMYHKGNKVHFDNKGKLIIINNEGKITRNIDVDSPQQIRSLTIS